MLNNEILFAAALQIQEPLYVKQVEFTKEIGELHIYIDFRKGAKFKCPKCGMDGLPVHDTIEKTWRHLNFFQYKAFLHYRTPRSDCPEHGAHLVETPLGSSGSGFTLLFEALVLQLAACMPVSQMALLMDEHDTLLWRIIGKYVDLSHAAADYSDTHSVGIDETSSKKGHKYVTLFVDMDNSRVIHVTEGKDASTITEFKKELPKHQCNPAQIINISADMSPAFKKGVQNNFPWVAMTFDKFHIIKLMNAAVDKVRREEQMTIPALKLTRYLWLYNPDKLNAQKTKKLENLKN